MSCWGVIHRLHRKGIVHFFCYYAYEDGDVIYGWPIRGEISFICPYSPCKELCDFENSLFVFIFLEENNVILKFVLFALIFLVHTANMYSGITVKTHVKTVKLNYSGLLYHGQAFAIHSTMQKCRWYNKPLQWTVFQVYIYSTAFGAIIKCKKIQWDNCKLDYSGLLYCIHFFYVSHICNIGM